MRRLPHPGHSWYFTQHAIGLQAETLHNFLKCAAFFEGHSGNYQEKITHLMVEGGLLTPNLRDGQNDAWRDYQQVLAELGLIYSTKISRQLRITEVGHMYLAGELGFAELMNAQALNYQYPNGQKTTIQSRLREALASENFPIPETMLELQLSSGVLLRPSILMLRILCELIEKGESPELSVSECQAFLIPCARNSEWPIAYSEICSNRNRPEDIDNINRHSRRNIQDWFKFLGKTEIFSVSQNGNSISVTREVMNNLSEIKSLCASLEDPETFWIPLDFDRESRMGWFDWFGHPSYASQIPIQQDLKDEQYIIENYVGGLEEDDTEQLLLEAVSIDLTKLDFDRLSRDPTFVFRNEDDLEQILENMRIGAVKRHSKTLLHDDIVKNLAEKLQGNGAAVFEDLNSVDLLAQWPSGEEAIFEIKTVTRRSLPDRMRSAVGQISEYGYRRLNQTNLLPDRVVVINTDLPNNAWQVDFLNRHLEIGLICFCKTSYKSFAPTKFSSHRFWRE
jgi:hypothetical protein